MGRWVRKILPPTYRKLLYTTVLQESSLGPLLGKEDVRTSTKSAVSPHLNDSYRRSLHSWCGCVSLLHLRPFLSYPPGATEDPPSGEEVAD